MGFSWWFAWFMTLFTGLTIWMDIELGTTLRNFQSFRNELSNIYNFKVGDYFNYKLDLSSTFMICLILKFIFLALNFIYGVALISDTIKKWDYSKIGSLSSLILALIIFLIMGFEIYIYSYFFDLFVNAKFEYNFENKIWYWTGDINEAWFKRNGIWYMNSSSNYYNHIKFFLVITITSKIQICVSPILNVYSLI